MKQEYQTEFREQLFKAYQKYAFEALALYTYWGDRFKQIKKQVDDYETRITKAKETVKILSADPNRTVAIKNHIKAQQADIVNYEKLLEGVKKPYNELEKKCIKLQEEAVEYLEQAKTIEKFTLNTPEEILKKKADDEAKEKQTAEKQAAEIAAGNVTVAQTPKEPAHTCPVDPAEGAVCDSCQ